MNTTGQLVDIPKPQHKRRPYCNRTLPTRLIEAIYQANYGVGRMPKTCEFQR